MPILGKPGCCHAQAVLCNFGSSLMASFICVIICSYTFVSFSVTKMPSCCLRILAESQDGGIGIIGVCMCQEER